MRKQIVKNFSLSPETVERIERIACATRRDYSTIVEMAVEAFSQQEEFALLDSPNKSTAPSVLSEIPAHKEAAA